MVGCSVGWLVCLDGQAGKSHIHIAAVNLSAALILKACNGSPIHAPIPGPQLLAVLQLGAAAGMSFYARSGAPLLAPQCLSLTITIIISSPLAT